MNKSNIIKLFVFFLAACLFTGLDVCAQSESENYRLLADVLDEFGGRGGSETCSLRIGSGGQPGVIGISQADSFHALQGYVHAASFVHGDPDGDGTVGLADAVYLINYVLRGGPPPEPPESGDLNCDGNVDLADVVYLINYLFRAGPPPCNS